MILSLTNVTRDFRLDSRTIITPVRNITLDVEENDFVLIIGRSGSGKTTLLNLAAGLIRPTSGEVYIQGNNIKDMSEKQLALLRSRRLGFVFQFPSLLPSLTVIENVIMPAVFSGESSKLKALARASDLLTTLGLAERLGGYPGQLSAGEQKRAAIARALINQPGLILADEPTSDLDEETEREVMELLHRVHSTGVTIMLVTHSLGLSRYATRAFEMRNGGLVSVPVPGAGI